MSSDVSVFFNVYNGIFKLDHTHNHAEWMAQYNNITKLVDRRREAGDN